MRLEFIHTNQSRMEFDEAFFCVHNKSKLEKKKHTQSLNRVE